MVEYCGFKGGFMALVGAFGFKASFILGIVPGFNHASTLGFEFGSTLDCSCPRLALELCMIGVAWSDRDKRQTSIKNE